MLDVPSSRMGSPIPPYLPPLHDAEKRCLSPKLVPEVESKSPPVIASETRCERTMSTRTVPCAAWWRRSPVGTTHRPGGLDWSLFSRRDEVGVSPSSLRRKPGLTCNVYRINWGSVSPRPYETSREDEPVKRNPDPNPNSSPAPTTETPDRTSKTLSQSTWKHR
jgi:hypothetical protein